MIWLLRKFRRSPLVHVLLRHETSWRKVTALDSHAYFDCRTCNIFWEVS